MVQNRQVTLLGDSILKGIQVDLGDRRYRTHNEINVEALESEFQLSIHNDAHFGATVRKGSRLLDRMLARKLPCDMMVMDFGGNDCDFRWKEIAEDPTGDHQPNVPLPEFVELYREMIRRVRSHGIRPILTNLPPLDSERFFNWWCGDLDKEAVMRWLGDVGNIYVWQERYSRAVERLAREENVPLVDAAGRSDRLTEGQKYGSVFKTGPYFLQLFEDVDAEGCLTVQIFQRFHPLYARLGGFPAVGRHTEEGLDIRLICQMEGEVHRNDGLIGEALVGSFLFLVGVGSVIENLLQFPQMAGAGYHIEKMASGLQDPAEFVNGQGGEAVQQQVYRFIRKGKMIAGGHCEFHLLFPFGGQPEDRFGDVDTGYSGRFPGGSQGCPDADSVVPLSAAGIQNHRMLAHKRQNPATKCI